MAIHRIPEGKLERLMRTKGKHSDGGGLILQVASPGQASWVFRYLDKRAGRERWPCIGPASVYGIEAAREKARLCRVELREGRSPFDFLAGGRAQPAGKAFGEAMADYLDAKSPTWADSNRARELRRYDFLFSQIPDFTALPIRSIDQDAKSKALATWEADSKKRRDVGFYIEAILRHALTGKLRLRSGAADVQHHEAMPHEDVPGFYKRLAKIGTVDTRALQFTILTGARTDEVIGAPAKAPATWAEIGEVDGEPTWIIPGKRMKSGKQHRVPLSAEVLTLLGGRKADKVPLFKVSSQNALLNVLKANGGNGYTVHGFRSSFSDWGVKSGYDPNLIDACIAHETRGKVRRAYQRSDQLERRRQVMNSWSDYLGS